MSRALGADAGGSGRSAHWMAAIPDPC